MKDGKPAGWEPEREQDHFMTCPTCGERFDCRDLGEVFEHLHGIPPKKEPLKQ